MSTKTNKKNKKIKKLTKSANSEKGGDKQYKNPKLTFIEFAHKFDLFSPNLGSVVFAAWSIGRILCFRKAVCHSHCCRVRWHTVFQHDIRNRYWLAFSLFKDVVMLQNVLAKKKKKEEMWGIPTVGISMLLKWNETGHVNRRKKENSMNTVLK